jgi:hypothetical protein
LAKPERLKQSRPKTKRVPLDRFAALAMTLGGCHTAKEKRRPEAPLQR